jgi:hypothetical protein
MANQLCAFGDYNLAIDFDRLGDVSGDGIAGLGFFGVERAVKFRIKAGAAGQCNAVCSRVSICWCLRGAYDSRGKHCHNHEYEERRFVHWSSPPPV